MTIHLRIRSYSHHLLSSLTHCAYCNPTILLAPVKLSVCLHLSEGKHMENTQLQTLKVTSLQSSGCDKYLIENKLTIKFSHLKQLDLLIEGVWLPPTEPTFQLQLFTGLRESNPWSHTVPHWYWQHLLWPIRRQGHLWWWCTDEETALFLTCRQPVPESKVWSTNHSPLLILKKQWSKHPKYSRICFILLIWWVSL